MTLYTSYPGFSKDYKDYIEKNLDIKPSTNIADAAIIAGLALLKRIEKLEKLLEKHNIS